MSALQTYRGWTVDYDAKPIPHRGFDWTGTHPDYDGEGDSRLVHAATFQELAAEIDGEIADAEDDALSAIRQKLAEKCGTALFPVSALSIEVMRLLGLSAVKTANANGSTTSIVRPADALATGLIAGMEEGCA